MTSTPIGKSPYLAVPPPLPGDVDRLLRQVRADRETGCWNWHGCVNNGRGVMRVSGTAFQVHRLTFQWFSGEELSRWLTVDHLCMNPRCCNPFHLEQVTLCENSARAHGKANKQELLARKAALRAKWRSEGFDWPDRPRQGRRRRHL